LNQQAIAIFIAALGAAAIVAMLPAGRALAQGSAAEDSQAILTIDHYVANGSAVPARRFFRAGCGIETAAGTLKCRRAP
jgi:hypothetical protein